MRRRTWKSGRLTTLALAVVVVGTLLALPAAAYAAKATTRIMTAKARTVHRDVPGVNPWPRTMSVKLQKKISATRYGALVGTVKLYRYDPATRAYRYVTSRRGSSVVFTLTGRGRYKLTYVGSTKTKPSVAYSTVYETIGARVSTPTISVESIPSTTTQSMVTVKYDMNWNTEAHSGPVVVGFEGYFEDSNSTAVWVRFEREIYTPGTVEFSYKVENTELLDTLNTWGYSYVDSYFGGACIVTPADVEYAWDLP